ncbi:hypothetical protein G7Z12_30535 [Streptomyces sp. ID38640]|uniref:hypothetical protein n=1 Tax=Streptomyces sp. ID38640 TaxID=1265399 RepID=UPI00140E9E13|nr:hypothetical protein [Streptomyces sp. ID38640]QIK09757.1 hypothetical protein G7Z12_30535 [Streptomyces sp. ID38640]
MSVLVSEGPAGAWAWAGIRLEPEAAMDRNGAHVGLPEAERRAEAAALEQVWLARQWQPDGRAFELRHTTAPGGGGVRCVLLCRMHGPDGPAASAAVLALRDAMADTPRHIRAAPVDDAGELRAALVPFEEFRREPPGPPALAEVRKRLDWARLGRADTDFPLGVAFTPLRSETVSWEPVWDALARAGALAVIGVCLEPYTPPPELVGYLRYLVQEYGRLALPGRPNPVFTQYIPPEPFAVRAAARYAEILSGCSDRHGYRLRISVAGEPAAAGGGRAVAGDLAEQVAASLTPPGAADGGAVVRPVPSHEVPDAWTNFTGLHRTWLDATYRQDVPEPLGDREKILADLVDLPQAAAAFRFPYEIPGRPPLFTTTARTAAPPARAPAPEGGDPHAPDFRPDPAGFRRGPPEARP